MEKKCGKAPHIYSSTPTKNMPSPESKQLEMKLFDEPLWNYARAIQIDSHACKAVLQKLCDDKPKEEEIRKHFRDNMLQYANVIEVQIDPHKELEQIIPAIIEELEEMLQNGDWMCAKLNTIKNVEWTLLEFDLKRLEKTADWEQIKELRGKWRKLYDDWFRNGGDVPDFAKVMEKMKTNLNVLLSGQV
uniref:DHC_N2 domain-containing protein n=1 Tax=Globodera pallida TaxID=36090 RepID=A0A183BMA9_GLOPA